VAILESFVANALRVTAR